MRMRGFLVSVSRNRVPPGSSLPSPNISPLL